MLYDTGGDEKLDMKEVGQLLRALGMTPTHLQVREIIREFDKNKNGVLEFKEFLDLYAKHKQPPAAAKELLEAFKVGGERRVRGRG
jgi:Ca2+-binding EF-hand superfamily protein